MTTNHAPETQALPVTEPVAPPRRRGAPRGNQNARKHGFYSRCFRPEEQETFQQATQLVDLGSEIALMRVKLAQLVAHPDAPPDLFLQAARAITRMVDVQYKITSMH